MTCFYWAALTAFVVAILGIAANRAAYGNGFHDGALWVHEGEGYPSKPHSKWWGWGPLRRRVGRAPEFEHEHETVGDGVDCAVCGEGSQHYLHKKDGK